MKWKSPLGFIIARNQPRIDRVHRALRQAWPQAREIIGYETGEAAKALLNGLLPTLESMALWAGGGAMVGGAVGAVGGGVLADEFTIPGGAAIGFDIGLWLGGVWGLKDLLVDLTHHLGRIEKLASDGVELAWYAGDDPHFPEIADQADASQFFAEAMADLWMVVLQCLIVAVLRQAGKVAGKVLSSEATQAALGEVSETLKRSKLGSGFADWFKDNFTRFRRRLRKAEGSGAGSGKRNVADLRMNLCLAYRRII